MRRARPVIAIARSVLLEAVRRKDIYVIVALCCGLIGLVLTVDFFGTTGLVKFYREIALKLMGVATTVAVLLLATRQLPREFELRTIYPLLARPVGRFAFLLGKGLGVCCAAAFCLALFMLLFVAGSHILGGTIHWSLLFQHLYLQMLQAAVLTAGCFLLSLALNYDAALAIGFLLAFASGLIGSASLTLYELTTVAGRVLIYMLTYALPQLILFDLSEKAVHSDIWPPLTAGTMLALTLYAVVYTGLFTTGAYALFRRRPL